MMADLVLPDNTYLERWQDAPTYPFQGWPLGADPHPGGQAAVRHHGPSPTC
jgi:anaerobic selenocysteine-containing dehydrogenase